MQKQHEPSASYATLAHSVEVLVCVYTQMLLASTHSRLNIHMHIEFKLPKSAGGVNALYPTCTLNRELERWCSLYGYAYTVHRTEYCLEVRFVDRRAYTIFLLGAPAHFSVRWTYSEED